MNFHIEINSKTSDVDVFFSQDILLLALCLFFDLNTSISIRTTSNNDTCRCELAIISNNEKTARWETNSRVLRFRNFRYSIVLSKSNDGSSLNYSQTICVYET